VSASYTTRPTRHRLLITAVALALLASLMPVAVAPVRAATSVFINEIHYDNTGTDAGEAIEVAGPAGTNLTGWSLVLYNGANGLMYLNAGDSQALSGVIPNQSNGMGTVVLTYLVNGIENGAPDGVALVDPASTVVQFLSYEGAFTAVSGPANGMTSTDIGVAENGSEPVGQSLQLQGTGTTYEQFTWSAPSTQTFAAVNTGQTFGAAGVGSVSLATLGVAYGQDFDTLAATGTANTTLPTGWFLSETGTNSDDAYAAGTGSNNAGNTYSFGAAGSPERAFGGLLSGSLNPTIGASFTNDTGSTINSLAISYTGEQWRVGTLDRGPDRLDFQYSLDATSLTTGTWTNVDALDFSSPTTTGIVGALDGNAPANRVGISAVVAGVAIANEATVWIRWTDFNASGADDGLAVDSFSLTPHGADPEINLSIDDVSAAEGNAGTSAFDFTVSLSNPAGAGGVTFDIATADDSATVADSDYAANALTGQTIPAGSSTYQVSVQVNGDAVFEPDEQFLVNVTNVTGVDAVTDGQGVGTIENDESACGTPATFIHAIQGSGATTPMPGVRTIEGIVIGDYQGVGQFGGYFVQEEDADADGDPLTSEGMFVFNTSIPVSIGDVVRVTGTAGEFSGMTQLASVTLVELCPPGGAVSTTNVILPVAAVSDLERYEGMHVTFTQELTVTEVFTLGRFGEVALSVGGRLENPTNVVAPGAPAQALQSLNDRSRILLDDANNQQNIDPTLYPQGGLSATNTLRVGDTLPSLTGVLEFRFSVYRVQPLSAAPSSMVFAHDNPRPLAPEDVGGDVQVAAFNVLNYFNGNGAGGGFPTARGAEDLTEFDRQRDKIISAITGLDADVVGLMELENDNTDTEFGAIEDLVAGLNDATAPGTWAFIDTGIVGTDQIRVGLIYQPANVVPVGAHEFIDSSVDPRFIDTLNRPSILQTFATTAGTRFSVLVNHLKSKGSDCNAVGDPDIGDGQGNCNLTRTAAAEAIVDWLATDPTDSGDPDVIVIGDLNSYAMEDPITVFRNAGYVDTIDEHLGGDGYSFVFQGQSGYLDHALASPSLAAQVSGVTEWHANADEPIALDYNLNFKSVNHQTTLYDPGPYRSSDHDPLLVGLDLTSDAPTIVVTTGITCAPAGNGGSFALTIADTDNAVGDLTLSLEGNTNSTLVPNGNVTIGGSGADRSVSISHAAKKAGTAVLTIGVSDGTTTTTVTITVRIGTNASEILMGTTGADLIVGGNGGDTVSGLSGADVLCGGNGNDAISGGAGNDALGGERGADTLSGGTGADRFSGGQGADVRTDFDAAEGDTSDGT
jgi:predicted extracellular nuclease